MATLALRKHSDWSARPPVSKAGWVPPPATPSARVALARARDREQRNRAHQAERERLAAEAPAKRWIAGAFEAAMGAVTSVFDAAYEFANEPVCKAAELYTILEYASDAYAALRYPPPPSNDRASELRAIVTAAAGKKTNEQRCARFADYVWRQVVPQVIDLMDATGSTPQKKAAQLGSLFNFTLAVYEHLACEPPPGFL
jgi:hypothetical protein